MTYVVDASVAAKWFLNEPLEDEAKRLLDYASRLQAPNWIIQEVAQTAFKKWRDGDIGPDHARTIVQAFPSFIGQLYPSTGLADHALHIALALKHAVYDCLYLACAEVTGGIVITADKKLCAAVEGTEFASLVRYLGALDFLREDTETLPPLTIPLSRIERIIRQAEALRETMGSVDAPFPGNPSMDIPPPDRMQLYPQSPVRRALIANLDRLSGSERAELLALMWLGRGDDTNWLRLRERAFGGTAEGDSESLATSAMLATWLRAGLDIMRQAYPSSA